MAANAAQGLGGLSHMQELELLLPALHQRSAEGCMLWPSQMWIAGDQRKSLPAGLNQYSLITDEVSDAQFREP